jgi:hypothetical protein
MAAIRAAPKDRMNWMTSCTFILTRAHSHWARFARFMVTVWLRSRPPMRFRAVLAVILVPKCCLIATVAGPIRLGRPTAVSRFLPGKRSLIVDEGNIESPPIAVGATNQFKPISSIISSITQTPAQGAGVVRHERGIESAYWRYC